MLGTRSRRSSEIRSTSAHWRANDPFTLARKNKAALKTTAIYFNCGHSDDYRIREGRSRARQATDLGGYRARVSSLPRRPQHDTTSSRI